MQNFAVTAVDESSPSTNFEGTWSGRAESSIFEALSGVECGGATVSITITNNQINGLVITDGGLALFVEGSVSTTGGLLNSEVLDINGDLFAIFTGSLSGDLGSGKWIDIYGCYGTFSISRD